MEIISIDEIRKGDLIRFEYSAEETVSTRAVEFIAQNNADNSFKWASGVHYLMKRAQRFPHEVGTLLLIKGRMPLYRDADELWHFVNTAATTAYTDEQLEERFTTEDFVVLWSQDDLDAPFEKADTDKDEW